MPYAVVFGGAVLHVAWHTFLVTHNIIQCRIGSVFVFNMWVMEYLIAVVIYKFNNKNLFPLYIRHESI